MANLQVKSIDDQLYKSLGKRAAMENRSISQEVIHILKSYLATPASQHRQVSDQFLALCGSWDDQKTAVEITDELRNDRSRNSHREVNF
jgi:plasmid stability protein